MYERPRMQRNRDGEAPFKLTSQRGCNGPFQEELWTLHIRRSQWSTTDVVSM